MSRKLIAEMIGTFWLVLGGCGTAILAGNQVGILGVSAAFGLAVLTGAFALGHISGAHFNPAVSVGLWVGGRFRGRDVVPYIVAQGAGAILAASVLYVVAQGYPDFLIEPQAPGAFASNGYGALSPDGYALPAAFLVEALLTASFVLVIMAATRPRPDVPSDFAPLIIGLALTLIHLVSIPVTNTSVNPARSSGMALFAGAGVLSQLWLFWAAPLLGGAIGGATYRVISLD
ncbi:aquaporin Z [Lysobacter niastensis]|uniref:aquaporin Z n=1 Tax=Lysobacter niastensis TaxID=380629 RepID=UPI002B4B7C2C|nr:aquaporin Z [Lysobacter niastensis]